jgi:uncharacterized membrane protein YjjB (DUF3815 family)
VGSFVQLLQNRIGVSRNTLDVAGCIPMIPGGFAAKAIIGLFALTLPTVQNADQTLMLSVQNALRVMFSVGAMGTGLAIPSMLLRVRQLVCVRTDSFLSVLARTAIDNGRRLHYSQLFSSNSRRGLG